MKLQLKITENSGNVYEVSTSLAVIVAWERKFKRKASDLASGNVGVEDLAFMAWEACKRANIPVPVPFDTYLDRLDDIDIVGDVDENPTGGGQ